MRQPIASPTTLRAVVDALSDERLRSLIVALAHSNAAAATAPEPARPATKRANQPAGKRRGRPRKASAATPVVVDPKLARRRAHAAAYQRAKRAAAAEAAVAGKPPAAAAAKPAADEPKRHYARPPGPAKRNAAAANGHGADLTPGQQFWRHAEALQPKMPWRIVARELGANEALALDCYRLGTLLPGITSSAVDRFMALPVPA